jgi:hypothetical protein
MIRIQNDFTAPRRGRDLINRDSVNHGFERTEPGQVFKGLALEFDFPQNPQLGSVIGARWQSVCCVCIGLLLAFSQATFAIQDQPGGKPSDQEIERLIEKLSSDKFAERELATRRLVEAGERAIPALEKAAKSPSAEVRIRAESVLVNRKVIDDSVVSESDQILIDRFRQASPRGRLLMLRTFATSKKPRLFLKLVELDLKFAAESQGQLQPAIETYLATNAALFSNLLSSAMESNQWADVEHIIQHPATLRYSPLIRSFAARGRGELESYIDDVFSQLRQKQADGEQIVDSNLVSLIGLLRLQKNFDRADEAIGWLPDQAMQNVIRQKIIFQRGDWNEILRRTRLDPTDSQRISANDTQTALLQYLAQDKEGLAATIKKMRTELEAAIAGLPQNDADPGGKAEGGASRGAAPQEPLAITAARVLRLKGNLRVVGLVTLDWNLVQEFLDPDALEENAALLSDVNRSDAAMELVEAGRDFESRRARMAQVLNELSKAQESLVKRSSNRRGEAYMRLKGQESKLSAIAMLMAAWAENHGLDDEAQLYYQMIFAADKSNTRLNQQTAMGKLLELGRADSYWQLAESMIRGPDKQKFAGRVTYGISSLTAKTLSRQWMAGIRGRFQDPVLEAKTVAAVVNSPWVDTQEIDFDLEYEIARYRTNSRLTTDGNVEINLSQVYELHGDDEASKRLLMQSVDLGNRRATGLRLLQAIASNDYPAISETWFDSYRGYRSASGCLLAEQAAKEQLKSPNLDDDQKAAIEQKLYRAQVATMAVWHGNSPWLNSGMRELAGFEAEHLSIFPLKAIVFGVNGNPQIAQRMEVALVNALGSKHSDQNVEATSMSAAVLFENLGFDSASAKSNRGWLSDALRLHFAWAKGLMEQGEYQRAADVLVRTVGFSLGDVAAGEQAIGVLQRAGANEQAERLYEAIAKHYIDTLQKYPDSPLARNNLAWLSACAQRDLNAAYRHAKKAVASRPNTVQYLDTLAEIEFLMGNAEKAFELSKRCVQLFPTRFYYRQQKNRFWEAMNSQ